MACKHNGTVFNFKISTKTKKSLCDKNYVSLKITNTSLRKYYDVIFAKNAVAAYALCLSHMGSYEAYFASYTPQIFTR